ncbi:unnamed protein product [Candida parapsilosis]
MAHVLRYGSRQREFLHKISRNYSSCAISVSDTVTRIRDTSDSHSSTTKTIDKNIHTRVPSKSLTESYELSSVFASNVQQTRELQIKNELIHLIERKSFDKLVSLLETWSLHDLDGMVKTLGRDSITRYLRLIIKENRKRHVNKFNLSPIQKSSKIQSMIQKSTHTSDFHVGDKLTEQIRNVYRNLIYNNRNEHFYNKEKCQNIYSGDNLTGYKLTPNDYENLMQLELGNYKLDLASRWFYLFRKEYGDQWKLMMTPKLWTLAFKIDGMGDNRYWTIKGTDLSSFYKNPLRSKFKPGMNMNLMDVQYDLQELDLGFHSAVIQSLAHAGRINDVKSYVSRIWGVDENGKLMPSFTSISRESHLYPTIDLITAIFVSLAYNGEFYSGIKYINAFQIAYGDIDATNGNNKVFWEQVFKWANISTMLEESQALKVQTFDQLWRIVQNEEQLPFSNIIYKTYLDVLKEQSVEQKLFDYLSSLLKEYKRHYIGPNSFTSRSGLGFYPTNGKSKSIRVLYKEALKALVEIKGTTTYLAQINPLIEKWSLDESMKKELKTWAESKMPIYRKDLEAKREEFMNNLAQDDESLLELM